MENNKYFLPIAVIAAGVLIAGAVVWNGSHPAGNTGTPDGKVTKVNIKDVKTDGNPFLGQANAPVAIAFWSDFQCPYCKAFETGGVPQITTPAALPQIITAYVNTGKVKVVFMDFAFLGEDSTTAAEYSRSVWKLYPGQYFDWRTAMYNAQDDEGDKGFGDAGSINKLTGAIAGIDVSKVIADVAANKSAYDALIESDKAEATKVGIQATPSFVIGDKVIGGAYPFATFQTAIDALLK